MADRAISVKLLANVTGLVSGFKTAENAAKDFGSRASGYISRNEQHISSLSNTVGVLGIAMAGAAGATAKAAIDWESAWTGVLKTVDGTPAQLQAVEEGLRDLAKELPATHAEIAGVAEAAGQLGISTEGILGFTKTMVDLGETTNLSAEEAATALARIRNIMGDTEADVSRMGATIVDLGNNSATTEREITELSTRLAAAGRQAGLSTSDVFAFGSALTSVGVEAEAGGTAMSKVFTAVADAARDGGEQLDVFARVAGVSAEDFRRAFEEDAAAAITMFVEGMGRAASAGESTTQIFDDLELTDQRLKRAILSTGSAQGLLGEQLEIANSAWESNTALVDEAAKRYETTAAQMQITWNNIKDAAISFGETALPVVREVAASVSTLAQKFGDLPDPIKTATLGIVGGGGLVALGVAGLGKLVVGVNNVKTSMQAMGISAKTASIAVGAVGIALGVGAFALTTWAQNAAAARARTEELQGTLDEFGNVTDDTLSRINDALARNRTNWFQDLMGADPASTIDYAKKFGLAIEDLQGYIVGEADAVAHVKAVREDYLSQFVWGTSQYDEAKSKIDNLIGSLDVEAGALTEAQRAAVQKALADEAAGIASEEHADGADEATRAMDDAARAAEAQASELQRLIDLHREMTDQALAQRDAQRGYEKALDDATEALETNGKTLDITTQKGRDNEAALDRIAAAGVTLIDNLREQGVSQEELQGKMQTTRDDFIAVAEQMGLSETAASDLADQLGLIPAEVKVDVDVETETAKRNIANFIAAWDQKTIDLYARLSTSSAGLTHGAFANRAQGGYVSGPGTSTSDSIHARLSDGEYVVKAAAVSRYGRHLFDDLNQMRFATGGFVTPSGPATSTARSGSGASLTGVAIEGTLDLGGGLVGVVRGVIRDEFADTRRIKRQMQGVTR